jgi:hypothetical protein
MNYVTFSISYLRIPPGIKNVSPSIKVVNDTSHCSWACNEVEGKRSKEHSQIFDT